MALHVDLVSPERILWSGDAEMVIARTLGGGDIAFLEGHAPFVGALDIHPVTIHPVGGGADEVAAVHGGFVEVSDNNVTILSDLAELASQIDVARAERQKAEAERRVEQGDNAEAEAEVRRAHTRLLAAGGLTPH
jgi:F-type H+-transporting ATPase subunit epsilon